MRSRVAGILLLGLILGSMPVAVRGSVDPGPLERAGHERTRWGTAPSDADKQAAVLMLAADRAFDANDPRSALTLLEKLRQLRPRDPTVCNNIGYALGLLGDVTAASAAYRRATELDPRYVQAAFNLGLSLIDLDRLDEAGIALKPWVGQIQQYPALGLLMAKVEWARGRAAESRSLVDHILAASKITPLVLFETANILKNLGDPRAEGAFRKVMSEEPAMIGAPLSLVSILSTSGRSSEARKILDDLASRMPDHPSILWERGGLNAREGRFEEAVFDLDRVAGRRPELIDAAFLSAVCHAKLGRLKDALMRLEVVLDPARDVSRQSREAARRLKDQLSRALPTASIELPPDHPQGVRKALERFKDLEPKLDWLIWKGVAPGASEGQPFVVFFARGLEGSAPGRLMSQVGIWVGPSPWRPGVRPYGCPTVNPYRGREPWIDDIAKELEKRFALSTFEIQPLWHQGRQPDLFMAVGQPHPRAWLEIRGSLHPSAVQREVLDRTRELVRIAVDENPMAVLRAMSRAVTDPSSTSARVQLQARVLTPTGGVLLLDLFLHRSTASLLDRTPALLAPRTSPMPDSSCSRTEKPLWFDGFPAVDGTESGTWTVGGIALDRSMSDLSVYVGRNEVCLSAWPPTERRELPVTMRQVLEKMFPGVGKTER